MKRVYQDIPAQGARTVILVQLDLLGLRVIEEMTVSLA